MMGSEVLINIRNNFTHISVPMVKQGYHETKQVIIEDNEWIGACNVIFPIIKIVNGSIISV